MQFIFVNFFLLWQNDGVLQESLLRPSALLSLGRVRILFPSANCPSGEWKIFVLRGCLRTPSGQKFFTLPQDNWPLETKFLLSLGTTRPAASGDFPSGLHHFAAGEKNWQKKLHSLSFPILHDLLENKNPFLVFLAGRISLPSNRPSFLALPNTKIHTQLAAH